MKFHENPSTRSQVIPHDRRIDGRTRSFSKFCENVPKITLKEMDSELQVDIWCAESRDLGADVLRLIPPHINV